MKYLSKERFSLRQVVIMLTIIFLGIGVISYGAVTFPHTFTQGDLIRSNEVNQNFQAIKTAMEASKYWTVNFFGMAKPAWNDFQGKVDYRGLLWDSGSIFLTIPVELPHGSTIQEVVAYVYDDNADQDIQVQLIRTPVNDGAVKNVVATLATSGQFHTGPCSAVIQTVSSYPVLNDQSTFYFIITYGDYLQATHDALGMHTIRIKYLPEQL